MKLEGMMSKVDENQEVIFCEICGYEFMSQEEFEEGGMDVLIGRVQRHQRYDCCEEEDDEQDE